MPVYRATRLAPGLYQIVGEIEGTCFSIGGDICMTAGHVVRTLQASGDVPVVGVFDQFGIGHQPVEIVEMEDLPCDVGLLRLGEMTEDWREYVQAIPWQQRGARPFGNVFALGYAYGLYRAGDRTSVLQRGFRGHVVAQPIDFLPIGYRGDPFHVYELSFAAPRGLSGSPLLTDNTHPQALGVIIGNSQSRMRILEREEVEAGANTRTVIQEFESLSLGIAVHAREIMQLESKLLGSEIRTHVRSHGFLGASR
jgi:hypothetical protein